MEIGVLAVVAQVAADVLQVNVDRLLRAIGGVRPRMTEDQLCRAMNIRQSQWVNQKNGTEHISLTRLLLVPHVMRRYAWLTLIEEGIPEEERGNARVLFAVWGRRRMARMTRVDHSRRRTA